ncbi:MAG: ATP-binding cassette domain-containing protein [Thermodesulfobacteriota bacterium]
MDSISQTENKFEISLIKRRTAIGMRNIKFRYSNQGPLVLDIESLNIEDGERVAVIGPSGAGKTSLFRLIDGLIQPQAGEIEVLGTKIGSNTRMDRSFRSRIGFIYQNFNLIERATVFENVLWGRLAHLNPLLSMINWFPESHKLIALRVIEEVNLTQQINQRTDSLSGGQLQRVAIARVLAQEPDLIMADEPVSNLDPVLTDEILDLLIEVSKKHHITLLMNLHQPELAKKYAERIIGIRKGQIVYDSPEELFGSHIHKSIFDNEFSSMNKQKKQDISSGR